MATDLQAPPVNPLAVVLADPDRIAELDIDKLERLLEMQRKLDADAATRSFHQAFTAVQSEMSRVPKRGFNTHTKSRYALAEDVYAMLDPIITRHGFSRSLSTEASHLENHMRFVLTIRHDAGHMEAHKFDAPVDDVGLAGKPTKTRIHGMASSYTYVERHMVMKTFGVQAGEDDDGNAAGGIGPGAGCISVDQVIELNDLIAETGSSRGLFLKACRVEKLEELPLSMYAGAKARLEMKRATS